MTNAIVSRIPRDIIREILSHLKSRLVADRPTKFPWYLGHICTTWRTEFLSLCDRIVINFPEELSLSYTVITPRSYYERLKNVLRWFLDHNFDIPFSFTFYMEYPHTPVQSAYARPALAMLCEQSTRWLNAMLQISEGERGVLYQVKNRIPLLQTLTLYEGSVGFQTDSDTFVNAPVLSKLTLNIRAPWNFPWVSLTSLSFGIADDFESRFDVLSETVNLEELFIYETYFAKDIDYDKQVMLPRLAHLYVSGTAALKILRTPALVRLSINAPETESFSTVVKFFFHKSGCKLQQLHTRFDSVSNFMELVECTPDIQHLRIEKLVDIFAALQNLTADDSRITPLRYLRSLRLDHSIHSDELHQQLCAFVKSRSRRVELEGGMFVERLQTLVILQPDEQGHWKYGTELGKFCEECGIRLRYLESRYDIRDRWCEPFLPSRFY